MRPARAGDDDALAHHGAERERVFEALRRVLVEELHIDGDPDAIDPDTPLFSAGIGLDSLAALEIIASVEDAFDIAIPDDPRVKSALRTVNTLIDFILILERARDHAAG